MKNNFADNAYNQVSTNDADDTINILEILNMVLERWWLVLIFALVFCVAGFTISKLTSVTKYSSTSMLYINTQKEQTTADVNMNGIVGAQKLMPTYVEILTSKTFLQSVSDDIDNKYTSSEISAMTNMLTTEETNMMKITVTCTDPHDAYLISESIVSRAPNEIIRVLEGGSVKIIDKPEESDIPIATNPLKYALMGFLAGVVIAVVIIVFINMFDTRIKNHEELNNKFGLPILGEVPDVHQIS